MNNGAKNRGRLIIDRQSPTLMGALWRLVGEAKGDGGVLAPVTVVGPSQYANLSLRQELGRSGFVNVRFILLPMLAELLGGAAMAGSRRRPLTPVLENVVVRAVLEQAGEPLAQVREHPSTQASVRESFRQLRRVSGDVRRGLADSGGARREIVRLYHDFRRRTGSGWYDTEDLATAAADAVSGGAAPALRDLGLIVFYLPYELTPGQMRLVNALAREAPCAALLGITGDDAADGPVQELADELRPLLGESQTAGGADGSPPMPLLPGDARLHVAPDAHEELRRVIRQIMSNAEAGIPLHRMAVLYRMDPPYGSLVREEMELAGIPMAGPGRKSLGDTAAGRALTGLLKLAAGLRSNDELRRDDVMAWLTGCPIRRPQEIDRAAFSPSRWDAISRKAGVVRGLEQWRGRLSAYAQWQENSADGNENPEELTPGQVERMASAAAAARAALRFVGQLAQAVNPPRSGSSWGAFCVWAEGLLRRYLRRQIPDGEIEARDKILRVLEELRTADEIEPSVTLSRFRQAVEESLQQPVGHLGVTGEGVFVSSFSAAAGMSFDAVWMVGMIEGAAPPQVHDDPLLPESEWQEAGGPSRYRQRAAKERYDYLSAVAAAGRRAISYPVADPESRRKAFPSRWLLEQAEALAGETVYADGLAKMRGRPWLTVAPSLENSLSEIETPADGHDYNLQRLLRWKREGKEQSAHPLAQDGPLAAASRLNRSRASYRFTEFDGNLSAVSGEGRFAPNPFMSPVSATSLESWAVCPFRYFLSHVLRLSPLADPAEEMEISALDRGSMVHKILERFIRETSEADEQPQPGETWGASARQRMAQIAGAVFQDYESRGLTGKSLLWQLKKRDIQADLDTFLEEDARLRAERGTAQVLVETKFGPGKVWPEARDDATGIRFRGTIDRVDLTDRGAPALIIDYKTGGTSRFGSLQEKTRGKDKGKDIDPIDGGKHLQLAVYSLAAQQKFPDAESIGAAYWFVTANGKFELIPDPAGGQPFDINRPETLARFREGVSAIAEGIRGGVFPANPGSGQARDGGPANCAYCDFNSLCPSRRRQLWERKKQDGLVSGYLSLSADGERDTGEEGE